MTRTRPRFILAGGGTGGHLYPGLAVAHSLRTLQSDFEIVVFGTNRPIDQKLCETRGYELVPQSVQPMPSGYNPAAWWRFFRAWRASLRAARQRCVQRPPVVVLGLGGYAAAPPIIAAAKLGIPTALFNPDALPGRANRRLIPRVDRVFVQWERTADLLGGGPTVRVTGCPVRAEFLTVRREEAIRALKLDPEKKTMLVTGASQGSRSINATMLKLIDLWRVAKDWQLIHLAGEADFETCRVEYLGHGVSARVLAFTEQMWLCMAAADLIVSRAGASTLAEVTAVGRASVLLPYPFDRLQHQKDNAAVLAEARAAEVVEDANDAVANARRLLPVLRDLMKSDETRRRMARASAALGRADAADSMAAQLLELVRGGD
jgi:UDP-N-acetylglucosamine--N-acetylmuramyl-(pentapeptide) pyrophosphoryl-undecaprenol N-acetylglucosamine transferase